MSRPSCPRRRPGASIALGLVLTALSTALPGPASNPQAPGRPALQILADLGPPRANPNRQWTILSYLAGDNDLDMSVDQGVYKVSSRARVTEGPRDLYDNVILIDHSKDSDKLKGAYLLHIRRDHTDAKPYDELADLGEVNMGDPAVLAAFLGGAMNAFPSPRTALFLSDHGGGWTQFGTDEDAPGAAGGRDHLTMAELRSALADGLKAAGRKKVDLLVFDACLMAQLEVAAAVRDLAEVVVFSQSTMPSSIWTSLELNQTFLARGIGDGRMDIRQAVRSLVELYGRWADEPNVPAEFDALGKANGRNRTMSGVDLRLLPPVLEAFNGMVSKLLPSLDRHWPAVARAIFHSEFVDPYEPDSSTGARKFSSADLLDLVRRLRANVPDFPADAEYRRFEEAYRACVIVSDNGNLRRCTGLSIFAPWIQSPLMVDYRREPFVELSPWPKFLERLHELEAAAPALPRLSGFSITDARGMPLAAVPPLGDGRLGFTLEGANALGVRFGVGTPREDGIALWFITRQEVPPDEERQKGLPAELRPYLTPSFGAGATVLAQELAGLMPHVVLDGKVLEATIEGLDGRTIIAHAQCGDKTIDLIFDANTWEVVDSESWDTPKPGTAGPIKAAHYNFGEKSKFQPVLQVVRPDGNVENVAGPEVVWGKTGPRLALGLLAPGRHLFFIGAVSTAGKTIAERVPFTMLDNPWLRQYALGGDKPTLESMAGGWKWQVYQTNPATGQADFADVGLTINFTKHDKDHQSLVYRTVSAGRKAEGIARLEAAGLPVLSLYAKDPKGMYVREAAMIAVRDPESGPSVLLMRDLGSPALYRFVR